jgi:pyridoxal phosphate-dependent aminotransferase EpsN
MSRTPANKRIFLSPPHMGGEELRFVHEAFESNYIAPLGPQVDAFEREFCEKVGISYAAAVSSGTAAMHLALHLIGVGPGDEVLTSTLTFIGGAAPITFLGAKPVFVDCNRESWNMDPEFLARALAKRASLGRVPKALVSVHLYGQCADIDPILETCNRYGITLIEDAAEALGAIYNGRSSGTLGKAGIYSFNGNKIITTSGGGMLVSDDGAFIEKTRFLSQQARDPAPHYEHSQIGYNYRMSNILAAIGRGQLRVLDDRVKRKREIFDYYQIALGDLPGVEFMPEPSYGRSTRWLTCITIDPQKFGADREAIRLALEAENIESRPIWKPMHMQPVFKGCECIGGEVAEELFNRGLCLPSGTAMTEEDLARIVWVITETARKPRQPRNAGTGASRSGH